MSSSISPANEFTIHVVVLDDLGALCRAYGERDETQSDENSVVENLHKGRYVRPRRIIAFNAVEGWARDVTADVTRKVVALAIAERTALPEATRTFVASADVPPSMQPGMPWATIGSTTNEPTFLFDALPLNWQMTRWEKYGFTSILEAAQPKVGIEIGTYRGGSLQVIANYAEKIYSLDLDASLSDRLGRQLPNVEFLTGNSRLILPALLNRIMEDGEELGFVLIDGDHSTEGVRCDINLMLRYRPVRPVFIVFHDSFNPDCRQGILSADWAGCDYVHYVEVDFVPGVYHFEAFDTAAPRSMWGGLALAIMRPERRAGPLFIHQSQKGLSEAVFRSSRHAATKLSLLTRALHKAVWLSSGCRYPKAPGH
jgi:hypothetical protein